MACIKHDSTRKFPLRFLAGTTVSAKTEEVGFLFIFWYLIHRFPRQTGRSHGNGITLQMKKVNCERNHRETTNDFSCSAVLRRAGEGL